MPSYSSVARRSRNPSWRGPRLCALALAECAFAEIVWKTVRRNTASVKSAGTTASNAEHHVLFSLDECNIDVPAGAVDAEEVAVTVATSYATFASCAPQVSRRRQWSPSAAVAFRESLGGLASPVAGAPGGDTTQDLRRDQRPGTAAVGTRQINRPPIGENATSEATIPTAVSGRLLALAAIWRGGNRYCRYGGQEGDGHRAARRQQMRATGMCHRRGPATGDVRPMIFRLP
jgi:hypothetical protein